MKKIKEDIKEEVKEKKKLRDRLYTPAGVRNRKILCMLMFCGFMAGLYFCFLAVLYYGKGIFSKQDYFNSVKYNVNLQDDVMELLRNVQEVIENDGIMKEFSIYDVEKGVITTYNADDIESIESIMENADFSQMYKLKDWVVKEKSVSYDLSSLQQAKMFLNSDYSKNCYIYFSSDAFISLFEKSGIVNKNQKLSDRHSQESYMVYSDENRELAAQGYEIGKTPKSEIFKYNTTDIPYAVYDPVENIFYSFWDDYFELYPQYIYNCEELKGYLEENGYFEEATDSFVIPLLKSYNLDATAIWDSIKNDQNIYKDAVKYFERVENSGFLYYLESKNHKVYKNVELKDLAKRAEYAYIMVPDSLYESKQENVIDLKAEYETKYGGSLNVYNGLEETFGMIFPKDSVLYFGFDVNAADILNAGSAVKGYFEWSEVVEYIWPFTAGAAVCFAILLVLAVSLLITTGRTGRGVKEVTLCRFDWLPLELWLLLAVSITFGLAVLNINNAFFLSGWNGRLSVNALPFGISCIPFGIAFMEFSLSFARRIKAGNLWKNLLITRPFRKDRVKGGNDDGFTRFFWKIKEWIIDRYKKIRFKLCVWLCVFVILQIPCIWIMVECSGDTFIVDCAVSLYVCLIAVAGMRLHNIEKDIAALSAAVDEITKGNLDAKCQIGNAFLLFQDLDNGINHIGDGLKAAVETSLKDERMKTELITNVSHDLKTPLTSIINYIDLLKKEEMPNDEARHYIEVLETKAQRLKHLTEDLVEAAKATSGNIDLEMMPLTFDELMKQALGEFDDKFQKKNLTLVAAYPKEPAVIVADGRRLYRVIENVLQNAYKYALEGTRIYAELSNNQKVITFTLKNVSAAPLNISPEELMERFTRGDASRTTEGSGLGLSIAKDLTRLQGGTFDILLDGDLFKVVVSFSEYK
ncbi:MAG: HAMP domain-containing histidine kinase [Lachnospiraceae bacterium]|nr:HAMP domain-containing histidine kinase [Lachnospiraceae bacterium]